MNSKPSKREKMCKKTEPDFFNFRPFLRPPPNFYVPPGKDVATNHRRPPPSSIIGRPVHDLEPTLIPSPCERAQYARSRFPSSTVHVPETIFAT